LVMPITSSIGHHSLTSSVHRHHVLSVLTIISTQTTTLPPLSLHDALPICTIRSIRASRMDDVTSVPAMKTRPTSSNATGFRSARSEEHTSELQSLAYLVCRLLLDKKNSTDALRDSSNRGRRMRIRRHSAYL